MQKPQPKTSINADTRPIYAMLPQDLYVRLVTRCAETKTTLKSAISQAIFNFLDKD